MKTLAILFTMLSVLMSVAEDENPAAIKAIKAQDVTITVDMICPVGMPSISSMDGYTLSVKDGKVNAYLPFFGEVHSAMFAGADEPGIKFEDCPVELRVDDSKADKGKYVWAFEAKSGSENVQVYITLFTNGSADINCSPSNRSSISYSGSFVER